MTAKLWRKIWILVRRWWADVVFPASASVPSSSQQKKQTHSLQQERIWWFSLLVMWEISGSIPRRINWNGPGIPLHGFSTQPYSLRAKLAAWQSMVCRKPSLLTLFGKIGLLWKPSLLGPVHAVPFNEQRAIVKHTDIRKNQWAQWFINLEIPVLVRSLKSSNVELG